MAKAKGFNSIICNRPNNEKDGQPGFSVIAGQAQTLGLPVAHIPIVPIDIQPDDMAAFAKAIKDLPKPVLAYCFMGGPNCCGHKSPKQNRELF